MERVEKLLAGVVVLVAGRTPELCDEISGYLQSHGCRTINSDSELGAVVRLLSDKKADAIVLDVDPPLSQAFPFMQGLPPAIKKRTPLVLISSGSDPLLNDAFFEGAEAVFIRPFRALELAKGISFALETSKGRSDRKHERIGIVRTRVSYRFGETTVDGYATNFSRGGMFVLSQGALPKAGETIAFTIEIDDGPGVEVEGGGGVRWVRPKMDCGRPRGFGVEFAALDEDSLNIIESICMK